MKQRTSTSWSIQDLAMLYYLVIWGYGAKEISEILFKENINRTAQAIMTQSSYMRKFISKMQGIIVQNWDISPNVEAKFEKASRLDVPANILGYQRETHIVPLGARTAGYVINKEHEATPPAEESTPAEVPSKEPDILDVMKMAKELGASEVEYKGMKIKY